MKKFFAMFLSVLLVAFFATTFNSSGKKDVVKDVGYSLTIDQNISVVTPVLAIQPVSYDYLIARGVSVPYKGLSNGLFIINFKNQNSSMCGIDNYTHDWQRSNYTNNKLSGKDVNLNNKWGFRLDGGDINALKNIA
jgi:hypothetical protein